MKRKAGLYMDHIGPFIIYLDQSVEYFSDGLWKKDDPECWLEPSTTDVLIWRF